MVFESASAIADMVRPEYGSSFGQFICRAYLGTYLGTDCGKKGRTRSLWQQESDLVVKFLSLAVWRYLGGLERYSSKLEIDRFLLIACPGQNLHDTKLYICFFF